MVMNTSTTGFWIIKRIKFISPHYKVKMITKNDITTLMFHPVEGKIAVMIIEDNPPEYHLMTLFINGIKITKNNIKTTPTALDETVIDALIRAMPYIYPE